MIRRIFDRMRSGRKSGNKIHATSLFMSGYPELNRYDIGDWSYGRPTVLEWGEGARLHVGRFCSVADGVVILLGGEHRIDWTTTYPFSAMLPSAHKFTGHPYTRGDVVIGNDVWIARDALVRSGVKIGDGAVIGAASVVTRDVAPYSVVAGNPCRLIRQRFSAATCAALLRIAWWNWPIDKIEEALPVMLSTDVDAFVARYDVPNAGGLFRDERAGPPQAEGSTLEPNDERRI